jgi:hypothetical protein
MSLINYIYYRFIVISINCLLIEKDHQGRQFEISIAVTLGCPVFTARAGNNSKKQGNALDHAAT